MPESTTSQNIPPDVGACATVTTNELALSALPATTVGRVVLAPPSSSTLDEPRAIRSLDEMRYDQLLASITSCHHLSQARAAAAVDQALVLRNWLVGAYLVEFEQRGEDRARYGEGLIPTVAADLGDQGLKGLGPTMLRTCRLLYLSYPALRAAAGQLAGQPAIRQTLSVEFQGATGVSDLPPPPGAEERSESDSAPRGERGLPTVHIGPATGPRPLPAERLLGLRWSQFVELLRLDDPWKRAFYENECLAGAWSVRQLRRQIESLLYERTGLSTDKRAVVERARAQADTSPARIEELLRDPYVLEFTGLAERPQWHEDDLERALLDHLQAFLLELGTGFCFEARQFRIHSGAGQPERVDLVLYHRKLRCHVLIELKLRAFQHGDAGQMNYYLNWFRERMREEGDALPVGLLLCSDRDEVKVEYALGGMDNQLFVSRYLVALPSVEQLRAFLERDREWFVRERSCVEYAARAG
ncbi:MAG: DUF1016 family protein [Planctomycetes bacterium]|nr:DUF1016 family protein [Planctomycetota bacterium]